jgi:hypothetical protein
MHLARFALLTALLLALPGCPGPTFIVQEYPGPVRPAETIAILRIEGNGPVQLLAVDQQRADARIAEDSRLHVELLPGKHTVMVQNLGAPGVPPEIVAFQAEAGRVYQPVFLRSVSSGPRLHVLEIDPRRGSPVGDATLAPTRPPAPPRAPPAPVPAPPDAGTSPDTQEPAEPPAADGGPGGQTGI